jgi:hypothetical protein
MKKLTQSLIATLFAVAGCGVPGSGTTGTTGGKNFATGTFTVSGALTGSAPGLGSAIYNVGQNYTTYTAGTVGTDPILTLGTFSIRVDRMDDVAVGDEAAGSMSWSIVAAAPPPNSAKQWVASGGPNNSSPMGSLTFDVSSWGPSPQLVGDAGHKTYELHGALDAKLDANAATGALGEVMIHATY